MADKRDRWPENVAGRFYVDECCIGSKYCVSAAPANFRMDDSGHAYVFKQPDSAEEEEQCLDALENCPVKAIGKDGEEG